MKNRKMYIYLFPFLPILFLVGCRPNQQSSNSNHDRNSSSYPIETSNGNQESSSSSGSSSGGNSGEIAPPIEEKSESQELLEFDKYENNRFYTVTGFKDDVNEKYVNARKLVIPSHYKGLAVKQIAHQAFSGNSFLESVSLPSTIIEIGSEAFKGIKSLTSIYVSPQNKRYKSIDGVLFHIEKKDDNELLVFPPKKRADSFLIPSDVTSIREFAFLHCFSLKSIKIPATITSIGYGAFSDCKLLDSIEVDENNPLFKSIDGVLYSKEKETPKERYGRKVIVYPSGRSAEEYVVPENVVEIGRNSFSYNSYLTKIVIPDTVERISNSAFQECRSLRSITIPSSVDELGSEIFRNCESLVEVTILGAPDEVGTKLFIGCESLKKVIFSKLRGPMQSWKSSWKIGCKIEITWAK